MVKGKKGDTVAFRHKELGIPLREVEAAGGEKRSARFGQSSYSASHFPPEVFRGERWRQVLGGKNLSILFMFYYYTVHCSPGRVSQGEGQREVSL